MDRHVHLEGSLDPDWLRQRAALDGRELPAALEALWRLEPVPFGDFIKAFFFGCGFLRDAGAVQDAVRAAVRRLPAPDVCPERGLDLWVSPHLLVAQARFISLDALWRGLEDGIREAATQGVPIVVVLDAVNHFGPDHGHQVLDLVLEDLPPWVRGFSTGGLEGVPFRDWAPVFQRARQAGLRLAAHAGENGPGSNVREAILEAGVERIVHGVRAADQPDILELMVDRRIALDVCLTSNQALVPGLADDHPLPTFLRAGVRCALGTDDPGLIPCTLPGEWAKAAALGLTREERDLLLRHAAEDAWCRQAVNGA